MKKYRMVDKMITFALKYCTGSCTGKFYTEEYGT